MKTLLAAVAAASVLAGPACAGSLSQIYSSLFFLGDSLVDDGNYGAFGPPPPYFGSRFSNGPVFSDVLAGDFADGTTQNYAFGGARAETTGAFASGANPPDLEDQLGFFAADLLGLDGGAFEGTPTVGDRPLVVLWIGANDAFAAIAEFGAAVAAIDPADSPEAQAVAYGAALAAASEAAAAAALLVADAVEVMAASAPFAAFGLSDFAVLNLPDLSLTPEINGLPVPITSGAQAISAAFNDALSFELGLLSGAARITEIDAGGLFAELIAGTLLPGLTELDEACFIPGESLCSNPEDYAFWDSVHPTQQVHAELARQITLTMVPLPPALALMGAGLGGLALLRRRRRT